MKRTRQNEGISIAEAAKALRKDVSTVQKWIQKGAPCRSPGQPGRGRGAIVNISDLVRWKTGTLGRIDDDEQIGRLAAVLWDVFLRDSGGDRIGITKRETAGLLILVFERFHRNVTHEPVPELEKLPEEIKKLFHVWLS